MAGHNKDKAARMLGISKSTLWRKCHEMRPGAEDPA
ncbi:helix-turn-helix domain-containing protein [uncultured Desulfovibrio sp.]